ncbi:MAG TPA: hypothetical protein DF613_03545 [Lachnospiraceae bacterium]|nr:hypothetical protein [Lachnospiraceae bacterium]
MIEGIGIVVFCVAMVIVGGAYAKRSRKSSSDYFLSGRQNSVWLIVAGHVMGWVGAGTLVGVYGSAYSGGLGAGIWYPVGFSLSFFVFGPIMARRVKRLGDARNVYTFTEILRRRFTPRVAGVYTIFETIQSIAYIVGQYMAIAIILDLCMGVPYGWACAASGIIVLVYVALGGLTGSLVVTLIQMGICIAGLLLAIIVGIGQQGSFSQIMAGLPEGWEANPMAGRTPAVIIAGFLPTFMNSFRYSGIYTRTFSAKDEKTAVKACYLSGVVACTIVLLTALGVFVCVSCVPGLENGDYALIELFRKVFPWGAAIFAAAIVSACMSTASEAVIIVGTVITRDIVQGLFHVELSDKNSVRMGKAVMVCVTAICIFVSVFMSSVLDLMYYAANLMAAFAPAYLVSAFWNRVNTQGFLASMVGGILTVMVWGLVPAWNAVIPSLYVGIAVSLTALFVVTFCFPPPSEEQIDFIRPLQTEHWQ